MGELGDEGGVSEQFGDLPARLRERILQARRMGFPKEYEEYLESYYRRLAREEGGAAAGAGAGAGAGTGTGTGGDDG